MSPAAGERFGDTAYEVAGEGPRVVLVHGLGMNRAMLFLREGDSLRGVGAVGPRDRDEADRVWRSIEAEAPDLSELYTAGLRAVAVAHASSVEGDVTRHLFTRAEQQLPTVHAA